MELAQRSVPSILSGNKNWKGLFCTSGIMLIITAVIWVVVSWTARSLYSSGYPGDPEAYLHLVSQHQALAALTWSLWIVADFLMMAPTVAMYIILRRTNGTLALLGSMFAMFFNIYDICVTELNSLTLVSLAHGYAAASTEALKASFVTSAAPGYYGLPLQTVLSFATGSFGYLLWCIPMFRAIGIFHRWMAIFGAFWSAVGVVGSLQPLFPSSILLYLCMILCVPMVGLWFIFVGVRLYRYGKALPANGNNIEKAS